MQILAIVLIVYGAFILFGLLAQLPLFYRNPKSKALIKLMGKTGYNILLLVFGLAALIGGILLLP
ncbi:MAG: hypothetical protein EA375_06250 [Acholeplasmataceae bacterium]|nr:MAG: hypothetical protein EA375_06250 [Acholeplasmataceae bacterium]